MAVETVKENSDEKLAYAVLSIKSLEECKRFLTVLLSRRERIAVTNRWRVIRLLLEKRLSQNKTTKETGVAIATVSRAQRTLEVDREICQLIADRARKQRRRR